MNKTVMVFVATLVSISSGFAQIYLTDTNIVGGSTAVAFINTTTQSLFVVRSTITGGAKTNVIGSFVTGNADASGLGAVIKPNSAASITDSALLGGSGGIVDITGSSNSVLKARGAAGGTFNGTQLTLVNSIITGGNGGSIKADSSGAGSDANGSIAMLLLGLTQAPSLSIDSSTVITGGNGGTFTTGPASTAIANGGDGAELRGITLTVPDGTFIGGDGGTVTGSADSTASGGAGLFITGGANVTVNGGTFKAGAAGTVNGSTGIAGDAIRINGSVVSLAGGSLVGDILFSGGTSTLSVQNTFTDDAAVVQAAGTTTVNLWSDGQLADVTIQDGTMNFTGQTFNLDGIFALKASTAKADFQGSLTVVNSGTLNLGLGTVAGSTVRTEDGSQINTTYNGTTLGKIASAGSLTVGSNTTWTINAGTNAVLLDQTFDIATAAGGITNNITGADMVVNGSGGEAGWLGGISELDVIGSTILRATYGAADLDDAVGVGGDTSTEFGKAMADFSSIVTNGTAAYNDLKTLASSQEAGAALMTNSYVRSAEMANTLIGLQAIFADQIRDRTRSNLREQEVGYPAASTPAGSAGWEAMRLFSDRMEDAFGANEVQGMVYSVVPDIEYDDVKGTVDRLVPDVRVDPVSIPADYQAWGRGYGSFIEQDSSDGFAGYDATMAGGILGLDKQFNNMLVGIAGGYARTVLEGYAGKDGNSDTGHAVAYFSAHGEHAFLDASANYAYNDVETEYKTLGYTGDYAAHTVGLYLGGGYAITIAERVLLVPEASILNTLYMRDAYTESSDLYPDLEWDSYDQWSHLGTIGATLSMLHKISLRDAEMAVQPELRAHLLHEFNDEFDDETYHMVGGQFDVGASLLAREEDLIKVGAGVRLSKWASDTTEIGLDLDGTFGDDYEAYIVSGKIIHRF